MNERGFLQLPFKVASDHLPFNAQSRGEVSSVAISDVRIFPQKAWHLFVSVQSDSSGHKDRPVLITAQLYVLGILQHLGRRHCG